MIKTPLRYPGGKSKHYKYIAPLIENIIGTKKPKNYIEPYVGGGSVFLNTAQKHNDMHFVINDLHKELFFFWHYVCLFARSSLFENGEFIRENLAIYNELHELKSRYKDDYKELYNLVKKDSTNDLMKRARNFFILNRVTFSGTSNSGGFSKKAADGRFTDSSIERLVDCIRFCSFLDVTAFGYDGVSFMNVNNNLDTVAYIDPPYYTAKRLYGDNGDLHKQFDHDQLAHFLKYRARFDWVLSYDNCDYVREKYKDFYIYPISLQYGMDNYKRKTCKKGMELLITNVEMPEDYQPSI
ncbi:DNA adenine methylase [Cognatishimia sp.]|uniref:DNA adenine methylase n=1 Tax=Cognatishimia sp. TaxID=2211648 RepID=UPI003513B9E5|nr:DNA adenine methylase [Cognatishimia sp.]